MSQTTKSLAAFTSTFIAEDGGSQCPARVRINGQFMPIEEAVKVSKRNNFSLIVLFCAKESLGKNAN